MTELNFRCRKCKKYFGCDVGKITFLIERERPHFEKSIVCPKYGILSVDEVYSTTAKTAHFYGTFSKI